MSRLDAALAGLVFVGAAAALAIPEAWPGNAITGCVETVVDGDSLKLDGNRRIRLHGIDAVELHQTCEPGAWRCGHAAWNALYEMIRRDRYVTCELVERDRYGRDVARCANSGGDLGRRMVALGWAVAYRKYSTAYVDEEAAAKAERLGIWAGGFTPPAEWRGGAR